MPTKKYNLFGDSKSIVDALKVPFALMVEVNKIKGNSFCVFNPFVTRPTLLLVILRFFISIGLVFLFPFAPLFSKVNGLWLVGVASNNVFFESSTKSRAIFNSQIVNHNKFCIVSTHDSLGAKFTLGFVDYLTYLITTIIFFMAFGRTLWYFPAILQLPNLINFKKYLKTHRPSAVYFTNHYDRWVGVIIDYCTKYNCKSVLIQHGIEDETTLYLSKKYQTLNKLICYDRDQAEIFKEKIYGNIDDVEFFNPSVLLIKEERSEKSVLIVGHGDTSIIIDEIKIIHQLLTCTDVFIYLKPHPVVGLSNDYIKLKSNRVKIITDKLFFPHVDILIHSGSTLALEYKISCPSIKIFRLNEVHAMFCAI